MDKFFIEQSIRETPLDNLRDDLGLYLKVLRSSMIELINQVGGPLYLESKYRKQLFTRLLPGLCRLCELVDKSSWSGWGNPSPTGVKSEVPLFFIVSLRIWVLINSEFRSRCLNSTAQLGL